jgi:hypothetical protein
MYDVIYRDGKTIKVLTRITRQPDGFTWEPVVVGRKRIHPPLIKGYKTATKAKAVLESRIEGLLPPGVKMRPLELV